MNYRHIYHAGNVSDLLKHALVLQVLDRMTRRGPLRVLDTHAGAGVYDLTTEPALRSGEARSGAARLMQADDAPLVFEPLKSAIQAINPPGELRRYPGSPALIVGALRAGDRYLGCELREDDQRALVKTIGSIAAARRVVASGVRRDGFAEAAAQGRTEAAGLILIDPPYERADDYARVVQTVERLRRPQAPCVAVWTPVKDLETFDALLRQLERLTLEDVVVAQARLRRLADPTRMNGCAMILINAPDVVVEAAAICDWIAASSREAGARGEVFRL